MPEVRIATAADIEACVAIVDRLSDYFTPDVADKVRADWPRCRTWVLVDRDTVAGFAEVEVRSRVVAEILWAAVEPERRGNGLGTVLVDRVLALRADEGLSLVEVKTLDESAGYEPYEGTVAFWESRGFVKLDVIDPFPEWQPGNPCAIYVRSSGGSATGPWRAPRWSR